ncbi:MAG: hypothetical protein ABJA89_16125, partial [Lapillicoccus sp.]
MKRTIWRAWRTGDHVHVVSLSALPLSQISDVHLDPAQPGQIEVADVRDPHRNPGGRGRSMTV